MAPLSLSQLYQGYMQLRQQLEKHTISYQQFIDGVRGLQAQDSEGRWWTINPETGRYLTYTAAGWVEATPTSGQGIVGPTSAEPSRAQPQAVTPTTSQPVSSGTLTTSPAVSRATAPSSTGRRGGCLASPLITLVLSVGAALVWFAYTSLSPSSESFDFLTPMLIAGTPLALRFLQKPLDKLLGPLYRILNALPRPLLVGAAFAVPLVMGGILTRSYGSGYQALRRSTVLSVLCSYLLTRRPEAN